MPQRLDVPDHAIEFRRTIYLVRLWLAPLDPSAAWAMDDWLFEDASDVTEVLDWAKGHHGVTAFEVFARADPHHDWMRLHGMPADGREFVTEVSLTTE
jgi:hypothetical protein